LYKDYISGKIFMKIHTVVCTQSC